VSPSLALARKRKASQVCRIPPRPSPRPGLAQNRVAVSDSETWTQATPKRLKRTYAFYEPLSASRRSNVSTHGKQICSYHTKANLPT
jgi:hypothetical protein